MFLAHGCENSILSKASAFLSRLYGLTLSLTNFPQWKSFPKFPVRSDQANSTTRSSRVLETRGNKKADTELYVSEKGRTSSKIPEEYAQDSELFGCKSSGVSDKGDVQDVQSWKSTGLQQNNSNPCY